MSLRAAVTKALGAAVHGALCAAHVTAHQSSFVPADWLSFQTAYDPTLFAAVASTFRTA
jgi:hypothetical protein